MEYVEGAPVSALITAARRRGELLPVQICLRACLQAAQALHAAHELVDHRGKPHGFLHRDVSPQNILVGFDGLARLTDFGVAQTIFTDQQTFRGTLKGKLRYMAPERLRFEPVDRRSDLFSLGVVLYEMLSSEHLFDAEGETEIAQQVLHAPTPDIGLVREGVPLAVVELLFQLLARDPAYRPASAAAVAERLDAALTELEFEQGKAPTELYMEDHFGQERRERQQQVSEALGRVSAGLSRARAASRFGLATVLGSRHRAVVVAQPVRVSPEPRSRADPVRAAPRAQPAAEPGASASATVLVALPAQLDQPSAADSGGRAGRAPRPARPPLPRRTAASAQPSPPSPRCNPPFYYDEHGVKRVRKECF
jgi:serine/threonine protein kinase